MWSILTKESLRNCGYTTADLQLTIVVDMVKTKFSIITKHDDPTDTIIAALLPYTAEVPTHIPIDVRSELSLLNLVLTVKTTNVQEESDLEDVELGFAHIGLPTKQRELKPGEIAQELHSMFLHTLLMWESGRNAFGSLSSFLKAKRAAFAHRLELCQLTDACGPPGEDAQTVVVVVLVVVASSAGSGSASGSSSTKLTSTSGGDSSSV
jgi:hypothetical protein